MPEALNPHSSEDEKKEDLLEGYEIGRLRERTIEEIENFDINKPGLVVHGSGLYSLESIIKNGLGQGNRWDIEVDFHVVGAKVSLVRKDFWEKNKVVKIGFGDNDVLYGHPFPDSTYALPLYLVSDVFEKMYPEVIEVIIAGTSGTPQSSPWEHIAVPRKGLGVKNEYDLGKYDDTQMGSYRDSRGFMAFVSRGASFFVKMPKENNEGEMLIKKLLSPKSINGIVIAKKWTKKIGTEEKVMDQEAILEEVVEIQNRLLPKEEQIPCYSTDGKCLYNPLKI